MAAPWAIYRGSGRGEEREKSSKEEEYIASAPRDKFEAYAALLEAARWNALACWVITFFWGEGVIIGA